MMMLHYVEKYLAPFWVTAANGLCLFAPPCMLSVACMRGVGVSLPSPSQRRQAMSARIPGGEEPNGTRPASPQRSLLQQNVQNRLRQLEQLQYDLTKQVACRQRVTASVSRGLSESWRKGRNAASIRSPVVDEEMMSPGHWLELVLCVSFSALTLMVG